MDDDDIMREKHRLNQIVGSVTKHIIAGDRVVALVPHKVVSQGNHMALAILALRLILRHSFIAAFLQLQNCVN